MVTAINGLSRSWHELCHHVRLCCCIKKRIFPAGFANIGLVPDGGATWILPRVVGWRRAVELSMLGTAPAETALEWG